MVTDNQKQEKQNNALDCKGTPLCAFIRNRKQFAGKFAFSLRYQCSKTTQDFFVMRVKEELVMMWGKDHVMWVPVTTARRVLM
jgi:hypothetical protein